MSADSRLIMNLQMINFHFILNMGLKSLIASKQ
jgi:hypothetical protein